MKKTYIVALSDGFVAQDVAEILRSQTSETHIFVERSLDGALQRAQDARRVGAVFLDHELQRARELGLDAEVKAKSGRFIVVNGEAAVAEQLDPSWSLVTKPFSTKMIMSALGED